MKKLLSILVIFVIVLSSCSSTEDNDKIFVRATLLPESLDVAVISTGTSYQIAVSNYSGIYEVNGNGELVLSGADSVEVSDDGLTYTVNLKEGLQWVDSSGQEMGEITANDYVFGYERILTAETQAPMSYLFTTIITGAEDMLAGNATMEDVGIVAVDDYTLEFDLNYVAPYFEGLLAFGAYYPQPQGAYEEYGSEYATSADKLWYNGAFYTSSYDPEYEVIQVKNESYWDSENVELDGVTYRTVVDDSASKEAFESGEIDYFETSDENLYSEGVGGYEPVDRISGYTYYLGFNMDENNITADKNLREALFYGFDRENATKQFSGDINSAVEYFTPTGLTETTYEVEYRDYAGDSYGSYDKERANEALEKYMDENNISDPADIELEFLVSEGEEGTRTSTAVQAAYAESLGISVIVNQLPEQQYRSARSDGNFDIALSGWSADYLDPSTYLEVFSSSNIGSINIPRYDNPEYDDKLKEAASISDVDSRMEAYVDLEQMYFNDYPMVTFYQKNTPYFIDENFNVYRHQFLLISDRYTEFNGEE